MAWTDRNAGSQQVVIYSNRPPTEIKGGAVKVIADLPVKVWVGPDSKPVADSEWAAMDEKQRSALGEKSITYNGRTFRVFTFKVPQSLYDAQYTMVANGLVWPLFHSTDTTALTDPFKTTADNHRPSYTYSYVDSKGGLRDFEKDYGQYLAFNALGNAAIKQLREKGIVADNDTKWVHDYQCVNIGAKIYSQHIPFPPLSYLKLVKIHDSQGTKRLLTSQSFKGFVRELVGHRLLTMQRPIDMANLIEVCAFIDPEFARNNSKLINEGKISRDGKLKAAPNIGDTVELSLFGKPCTVMNIPVGMVQEDSLKAAQQSRLDKSFFKTSDLDRIGIKYDPLKIIDKKPPLRDVSPDVTSVGPSPTTDTGPGMRFDQSVIVDGKIALKDVLGDMLTEGQGHHIFLAAHRNDYSKCTYEKLIAAANYMAKHPEEKGKTHFLYFLEPTRPDVPGYNTYKDRVEELAKSLYEKYGDSIMVIPAGIDNQDYLGLMRHPNVVGLLGVALKDGHDLTLREASNVRADFAKSDPEKAALAVITTNGTGASDILKGTKEAPGAFVINSDQKRSGFVKDLQSTFEEVIRKSSTKEGRSELGARYKVAAEASLKYSPEHYKTSILNVAQNLKEKDGPG